MRQLLHRHGFIVTQDDDLRSIARRECIPVNHSRPLAVSRVAVADH
jgi:rRNA-processing protein FCF1